MTSSHHDLLHIHSIEKVTLEFTTRCNLKCVYCAVTRPWHRKNDLDLASFDVLVEEMKALGVRTVQISGGGETTIVRDWDRYLKKLLDGGFRVSIISNLAKPMTDQAIRALSLCGEITTSIDSVDPELYEAIRKGGSFETFATNIRRIRGLCEQEGRKPPYMIWNAVASDRIISLVDQWVAKGISLGIDHFQISEFFQYDELPGAISIHPVGTMSGEDLARARRAVERARWLAKDAGKWFAVLPAVEEALHGSRKVMRTEVELDCGGEGKPVFKKSRTFVQIVNSDGSRQEVPTPPPSPMLPGKKTKNCFMPWTEAFVWATNDVAPCCMYKRIRPFDGGDLAAALNSQPFVEIREGLLSGNLSHTCNLCPMFEQVDVEEFRQRVAERMGVPSAKA
ncbi:MAG: radical SAM protein [Bryobacterales bacterium]|nr:radical SAM protein [Bryobacterales bacterium]